MALPTPIQITQVPKTGTPCYVLIAKPDRSIASCQYGNFSYSTAVANTVIIAATYADLQSQATAAGVLGLPAQFDGQP